MVNEEGLEELCREFEKSIKQAKTPEQRSYWIHTYEERLAHLKPTYSKYEYFNKRLEAIKKHE